MANYKRKKPRHLGFSTCGRRHCIHDLVHVTTHNGRDRYLPIYWKHFDGRRPWRYTHKNVDL